MSIVTDSTPIEQPKNPDTCNVFALYKLFAEQEEIALMREKYLRGGYGYGDAKKELLNKILTYFGLARNKYSELKKDLSYVFQVLKTGAEKARAEAIITLKEVRIAVGLD